MSTEYRLAPISAPRAAGLKLKLLTALIEGPLTGALLGGTLLKNAGINALRAAPVDGPLPPRSMPRSQAIADAVALEPDTLPELPDTRAASGFAFVSALDLTRAYAAGSSTPSAVAAALLAACAELDEGPRPLRAFIAQDRDDLLAQAAKADARWAAGRPRGPLDGVPVAIKDEVDQRGYPTTVGTSFLGRGLAAADAFAVARLRAAGALLVARHRYLRRVIVDHSAKL